MNSILFILLGIIIWQAFTFVVMVATNEEDEITIRVGCGLPLIILNSVMAVLRLIRRKYIIKNYTMAIIWNEKGSDGKPISLHRVRIKKGAINKYYTKGENQYYVEEFIPTWRSYENEENITHVRKNGWYCQEWINKNLKKTV